MVKNTTTNRISSAHIADVQGSADTRNIAINKVGIRAIRHPVQILGRAQNPQHSIASFDMYVFLPPQFKGTHMSRFVQILNDHKAAYSISNFEPLLWDMTKKLDAEAGYVEMRFPYFVNKTAPVSGVESLMDYDVTLIGEIKNGQFSQKLRVLVPVTSLCPCSKKISDYGAHNQRSHLTLTAEIDPTAAVKNNLCIEDLIDIAEQQASCELYGILKRPDEKFVTEHAYDNPKFVEDLVRDVAAQLHADKRIVAYVVESENFESIHNHSAYALIEHDKRQ